MTYTPHTHTPEQKPCHFSCKMDAEQFATFIIAFQHGMTALVPAQNNNTNPKISIKIPTFKGAPKDNVMTWMLQVQNLFKAQGIEDDDKKIYYAATGFEDVALHWYLNKIAAANNEEEEHVFADWTAFTTALREAFGSVEFSSYLI